MSSQPSIKHISLMLQQLSRDKTYLVVINAAPIFWFSLYSAGTAISGPGWLRENILIFLQLILLYPVVEELVFRGLLQERLWQTPLGRLSVYCISMPNIITSIIFTGFHFLVHPPAWALSVILPSLIFGFFRDRYQHVLPAILLHVFYNTGYFVLFGK